MSKMTKRKITKSKFEQRKQQWLDAEHTKAERSFKGNGMHAGMAEHSTAYLERYADLILEELASRIGKKHKRDNHTYWDSFEVVDD